MQSDTSERPQLGEGWWGQCLAALGRLRRGARLIAAGASCAAMTACSTVQYVSQAAAGQFELARHARPIAEVLRDPTTKPRTAELLAGVDAVKRFAHQRGLRVAGNYEQYVELERDFPVWFVNASAPLAFRPKTFSFPLLGSFPGLAWFHQEDARRFARRLEDQGYDVHVRGVHAFSTGGWLDDPVVWSMLSPSPAALGFLVNTVIHESVHATLLIKDQQYFNESLASFVADTMTDEFFRDAHGEALPEPLRAYKERQRWGDLRAQQLSELYQELDEVYRSALSRTQKQERKRQILDDAVQRLKLRERPNNASLIGFRLYQVGGPDFSALLGACANNWRRFLAAVSELSSSDFGRAQQSEIGPVLSAAAARGCPERLYPIESPRQARWRSKQRRRLREVWHRP